MADERDEIRSRVDIVDLVGQSVLLKKTGKTWKGLCPFHADKNPSFTVDRTYGSYRCWSCGEHGDIFTWVMKTRRVEFAEALQYLAELAGVTLSNRGPSVSKTDKERWASAMTEALAFFRSQLLKSEIASSYCERRGLSPETTATWELGYAPDVGDALANHLKKQGHLLAECKDLFLVEEATTGGYYDKFRGRLIFPIRSENGDLVAFGGRLLGEGHPKYINSSDTPLYRKSRVLYGLHRAKETIGRERRAILVEGYLDVIACHNAGVTGAVASLGTALSEDHAKLLRRWCDQVIVLYDSDAAGQKAADRAVEMLRAEKLGTRVALMPEGEDPDTLLRNSGPAAVKDAVEKGLRPLEYKVRKLISSVKPEEDRFWPDAIEILSSASNALEEDKYIVMLTAMDKTVKDQLSAQRALREEVRLHRKRKKQTDQGDTPRPATNPFRSKALDASEIAIFRAFMDPPLRRLAWAQCSEPDLFTTSTGRALAHAIRAAFPEPPTEKPAVWIARIEDDELRECFMAAQYDTRVETLTLQFLEDAIQRLRSIAQNRELQDTKRSLEGDARLREVYDRLKKRQPSENPEAS